MHHIFFVDQVKRSKKTVVYFCLLLVAAAFFVSSINLYQNSVRNLKTFFLPWLLQSCTER